MVKNICEGKGECCVHIIGNSSFHVGCYDPTKCESCDSVNGKIIKEDDASRLACKECFDGGSVSKCTNDEPDCCYGICYNAKCKRCNDSTKMVEDRCTNGQLCCDNSDHTGIGCYDPNANKCKKCENGQLVDKCSGDTPYCCPDNGNCINESCQNCDGSQKCTGNNYCCNCGSSVCCDKCEKCENGVKVNLSQDLGPCEKCENGEIKPKCPNSNQGCCNGECYDYGCQSCPGGLALVDNCEQNDSSTRCCDGSCYSLSNKCKYCENNTLKTYCANRTDGKTSCCPSNGSCYNSSDPCYDDCTQESKLTANQACCENTSTGTKAVYNTNISACCGGVVVPQESCCSGEYITNSSIYGCCPEAPEPGGSKYNRNTEGCCNNQDKYNIDTQECCNNTVINKDTQICCGGQAVTKEQGKECCSASGTLFSPKCEDCTANGVVLSDGFDTGCYECDPIKGPVSKCSKQGLSCCSVWTETNPVPGSCYNAQEQCDKCNATTGIVTSKCADSSAGPDCCFGECWNSQTDLCKRCNKGTGTEGLDQNKCVGDIFGKTTCCDDDGGCYGGCDSCVGGVQSNSLCKDRTDGKTACCDIGGSSQCYNPSCESCYPGNPPVQNKSGCKSCCNKTCCEGDCCLDGNTETCCQKNETCSNGKCCPQGQTNCGGECCKPSDCINGECGCPQGQELCGATCCDIGNCCNGVCLGDNEECCDGIIVNTTEEKCCTPTTGLNKFVCPIDEHCCGDSCCDQICCNNKDCCDVACCEGGSGGCYNQNACQECRNGQVIPKCTDGQACCDGVCYNPKECETCQGGQIIPYSPANPNCYCASGTPICNCNNFPTGWVLSESATADYDGVFYGSGGFSPVSPGSDTFAYDGMSSTFTSSYCYTGYMSIYVTCSDGKRVQTSAFTSYCGVPNPLPLQTSNPCCP